MGLHSSLKRAEKSASARSVMKRTERLKWLREKGQWSETDKVLGLPKIKAVKIKSAKKVKEKAAEPAQGAVAPDATTTPAAAPAAAQPAAKPKK